MKRIAIIITFICLGFAAFAQSDGPKQITPQMLQQIKASVEKQMPDYKQSLLKRGLTNDQMEFALDTFRIQRIVDKRMKIDYSTVGMNTTVDEMTAAYDKLMNKYYNKLLKILGAEDKKVLIAAQKSWIAYRDAESKLIWLMTKEQYSGGGTIQSNIATGSYSNLVVNRSEAIFDYYDSVIKGK